MATRKPLVTSSGTTQQIPDADTLVVGAGIDAAAAGALTIGATTATSITIGSAGITTDFPGPVNLTGDVTTVGGTTFTTDATFEGNVTFGNGPSDTVTFAATTTVVSDINFGGAPGTYKITNLANGTNPNDAVNVSQLSALVTGVSAVTASAPLASSGGSTPDISLTGIVGAANGGTGTSTVFTQGSVIFAGASGVYTQDNASLFFDDATNSLGIRTATPNEALTVSGVISVGEGSAPTSTAAFGKLWANSAADARPYWTDDTGQAFNLTLDRFNTLTPAASVAIDTSPALPIFNSLSLDQNTTFTTTNLGNGRSASVRVVCDGTTRSLTFPGGWTWLGSGPPSSLAANDVGYLSITAYGATDADVVAAWSYENQPAVVTGSGVDNQISIWSGTNTQDGSANLTFDGTTLGVTGAARVGIGTSTPAERLEVSGSDARINGLTVGRGGGAVSSNTALGVSALAANAAGGINNLGAGINALGVNTTGDQNVAVGASALSSSVTVSNQTAVGYAALQQATGGGNTALGASAGNGVTSGTFNVAVGESALSLGATASNSVAVGAGALAKNTANANVAVGADAGLANTTGVRLTAVGHTAASTSQTANDVTAVGYEALLNNGNSGSSNTAVGSRALLSATTGDSCTAVGHAALQGASTDVPTGSTAVGASALAAITTGQRNTAMGFFAGGLVSSAANNSYFGYLAGQKITGGSNTGLGYAALGNGTGGAGESNTAVGSQSLGTLQSGVENVAVGREAAFALTSGSQNVAVGAYALSSATTNGSNVAVGFNAMLLDTLGTDSVAVGFRALDAQNPAAASAMNNVAVGSGAGGAVTTGTNNTLLGTGAGDLLTTGANNVIIGSGADPAANSNTNTVVIGRNAVATGSNNVTFGNATTDTFRFGVATTALPNPGFSGQGLAGTAPSVAVGHTSATTASNFMVFAGGGGARGLISGNGAGGVNFTSLSDYRVKSEIEDIADPLARMRALHPCSFRMTGVAADAPRVEGFIAHEVQAIVPEAVAGAKDAVDAEGNPVHQGLDQSRLVPLLTAACQALVARAEAAEARLAALEAAIAALQGNS